MWTFPTYILKSHNAQLIATSVVTASMSMGLTYMILNKRLETKYIKIAEEEISAAKLYYNRLNKKEEFSDPTLLAAARHEEIMKNDRDYKTIIEVNEYGIMSSYSEPPNNGENSTVFDLVEKDKASGPISGARLSDTNFDYDYELSLRSREKPYVIHHDEFFQNDADFEQLTFTYFEQDDVLADERDAIVEDTNKVVGDANLLRFGHGSKDPNIVYVRNEDIDIDFEIVRRKGSYAQEVLGFIEHSESRGRPRKFRRDYE